MKLQALSVKVPLYEGLGGHRLVNILDMGDSVQNVLLPENVQKTYALPADALVLKSEFRVPSRSLTYPAQENASWNSQPEMAQTSSASLDVSRRALAISMLDTTCPHVHVRRSGNQHASWETCLDCHFDAREPRSRERRRRTLLRRHR